MHPNVNELFLVPSSTLKTKLHQVPVKKDKISSDCCNYKSMNVFSHSLAVALKLEKLEKFLAARQASSKNLTANVEKLANGDLDPNRGSKPKSTAIRRGEAIETRFKLKNMLDSFMLF